MMREGSGVRVRWDRAARACLYGLNLDFGEGGEVIGAQKKVAYRAARIRETMQGVRYVVSPRWGHRLTGV